MQYRKYSVSPNQGEKKIDFMKRCMFDEHMGVDYLDADIRRFICLSCWVKADVEKKSTGETRDGFILQIKQFLLQILVYSYKSGTIRLCLNKLKTQIIQIAKKYFRPF